MATFRTFHETTLTETLEAYSIYFVAPAAKPDYVEIYVTGANAATVKRVVNEDDIQGLIDSSLSGIAGIEVVDDIAARDALTPASNIQVLVIDASDDATVASGAATYLYRLATTSWIKISEAESLDAVLLWANIVGKPASSAADIDDAVTKKHSHANKTELDKIGEDGNGNLTYGGSLPVIAWDTTGL